MELLNSIRWNDALSCVIDDTGIRVLVAMFLLLLTTCCLCCRLYDPAPITEPITSGNEFSANW